MNSEEFQKCFDAFTDSTFRLETLQQYTIAEEQERIERFRRGEPRPERSVRTSPWLRRIAVTTAAGKEWTRVHVVDHPLSEYLRYQLVGYVENQAVGEQIAIADRAAHPDLEELSRDFWLFDADTDHAFAVLMDYDDAGHILDFDRADDTDTLQRCRAQRDTALSHAVHLNTYLAPANQQHAA